MNQQELSALLEYIEGLKQGIKGLALPELAADSEGAILAEALSGLERQINTDYLTGLKNRRSFRATANRYWDAGQEFLIAFIDLDCLKRCNDEFGHAVGDQYILELCQLLQEKLLPGEQLFRMGGDEFAIVGIGTDKNELEERLELARRDCRTLTREKQDYLRDFSFGCVHVVPCEGRSVSDYLSEADQKMYNYKTIHYLQRSQIGMVTSVREDTALDRTGLDSRIFEVFSNTSGNRYLYICNMKTNVSRWSLQAVQDFNLPGEYMADAGMKWMEYIHPDDRKAYQADVEAVFSGRKRLHQIEYRAKNKEGNYVICSCIGGLLKGTNGEPDLFAGTITNHGIVDNIDPVTNLYNVYEFLRQLARIRNQRQGLRILAVGLNQFTEVNNKYGYNTGNKVLAEVARGIQQLVNGRGQVYRLEGAKFLVMFQEGLPVDFYAFYGKVVSLARNQIRPDGNHILLELSGSFMDIDHIEVAEGTILAELLHALKISKRERLGNLVSYDSLQNDDVRREMTLLDTLQESVGNDCRGFYLVYQPQTNTNGDFIGAEALLRYKDAEHGIVPPGVFVPFLESNACFYHLGLWILQNAMIQTKPILDSLPAFQLSVNISYRQMEHFGFRDDVMRLLRETGFPARNLVLELTEHCRTLNVHVLEQDILFFKTMGIRISADDFGTGYSSFRLMRQLPFDCIKIDQSFIFHILEDEGDQIMVEAIINCARKLGMQICIEGVENKKVLEFIARYEPEFYQGYLFAKPMELAQLKDIFA